MKKLFLMPCLIVIAFSCNKTPETCNDDIQNQDEIAVDCGGVCSPCPVEYSETGTYGDNVLHGTDSLSLTVGEYSFKANVPEGSSLEVELVLISGSEWFYTNGSNGWIVSNYNGSNQTFSVPSPGEYDLHFTLAYDPNPNIVGGSFYIHYKENGTAITKSKVITWS